LIEGGDLAWAQSLLAPLMRAKGGTDNLFLDWGGCPKSIFRMSNLIPTGDGGGKALCYFFERGPINPTTGASRACVVDDAIGPINVGSSFFGVLTAFKSAPFALVYQ
jgi:hypothetical protein